MLLGCGCQCTGDSNDTPSQSEPPSAIASGSGSNPPVIESSGCLSCVAGVGPTVYQCTWAYGGTTQGGIFPCCGLYSGQSSFRLYRRLNLPPYTSDCCIWGSNEQSGRGATVSGQPVCLLTPSAPPFYASRVVLYMGNTLTCIPSGGVATNLKLRVYYEFRLNQFTWVEYVLPIAQRTPPYNCLGTMTLDVVKVPHKIFGAPLVKMWSASNSRDYGIGPCWSNPFSGEDPGIPDTVTLTPVSL
jgi:hypothetical protein